MVCGSALMKSRTVEERIEPRREPATHVDHGVTAVGIQVVGKISLTVGGAADKEA